MGGFKHANLWKTGYGIANFMYTSEKKDNESRVRKLQIRVHTLFKGMTSA